MLLNIEVLLFLCLCFFVIATLYSSIGFGGGSSYLALLALVFVGFYSIRSVALICNLVVVLGSTYWYYKNDSINIKSFLPFIISSIPMTFVGALFKFKEHVFFIILGSTLITSALLLIWQSVKTNEKIESDKAYPGYLNYVLGGAIGLLSGVVGIGGAFF